MARARCCGVLLPLLVLGARGARHKGPPGAEPGGGGAPQARSSADVDFASGPRYWDPHYEADPTPFDWLEDFADVRDLIEHVARGDQGVRILHPGCGNSLLPEELYDEGYTSIVNIDTSEVVVEQMAARNRERQGMEWHVMDATRTRFDDARFGLVIDKGVLDTFSCSVGNSSVVASAYLQEMARVLRPGGVLLCISFGEPRLRMPLFEWSRAPFEVIFLELEASLGMDANFAYVATKSPGGAFSMDAAPLAPVARWR